MILSPPSDSAAVAPAIAVRNLAKRFGAVEAVRDVSFEVAAGEIFGLIGPNGAGKTTVLECLLGLCRPDHGEISILGIDALADPSAAKERIGAQLQNGALPDPMTPRQALELCAAFYSRPARPEELIARFNLTEKADARFSSLSGGQRQRLALALAFVNDPDLVVLDEPTAGLDPPARQDLYRLIAAQRSAGRTIIFSTHYLEEARSLCDRVALIDRGNLIASDTPQELIARCGNRRHLIVRGEPAMDAADVRSLAGVTASRQEGLAWRLDTETVNRTVAALGVLAETRGIQILDLQIHRPSLDDVFRELTGRAEG